MSTSPTPSSSASPSFRSKKLVCPKVWKRPHSTIYGKNVEFGSSLYSDKLGEINGRKFNSELPWTMRNSGGSSVATSSGSGQFNQGYLSTTKSPYSSSITSLVPPVDPSNVYSNCGSISSGGGLNYQSAGHSHCNSYADLLEMTNPNRYGDGNRRRQANRLKANQNKRIDFYDQYGDFGKEIDYLQNNSLLNNEPLLRRKVFDNFLDYDQELGLFLSNHDQDDTNNNNNRGHHHHHNISCRDSRQRSNEMMDINKKPFAPLPTITQTTKLLPKHECNLMSSPYGQSADGRKLSLGSINPQSYRPSLPQKTTTAHASDGEEIDLHDKSSPFYTDRWAGRTIRHFDSDLYSNANLFKSMIL